MLSEWTKLHRVLTIQSALGLKKLMSQPGVVSGVARRMPDSADNEQ